MSRFDVTWVFFCFRCFYSYIDFNMNPHGLMLGDGFFLNRRKTKIVNSQCAIIKWLFKKKRSENEIHLLKLKHLILLPVFYFWQRTNEKTKGIFLRVCIQLSHVIHKTNMFQIAYLCMQHIFKLRCSRKQIQIKPAEKKTQKTCFSLIFPWIFVILWRLLSIHAVAPSEHQNASNGYYFCLVVHSKEKVSIKGETHADENYYC